MSRKHPIKYYYLKRTVDNKKWNGNDLIAPKGKVTKISHGIYQNYLNNHGYNDYIEITEDEYKLANLGK
jgi:hypothetical protein